MSIVTQDSFTSSKTTPTNVSGMVTDASLAQRYSRANSSMNMFASYKGIARISKVGLIDGTFVYEKDLPRALDAAIQTQNYDLLSKEQATLFIRYLNQSDNLTDADLVALDKYLSTFFIEEITK